MNLGLLLVTLGLAAGQVPAASNPAGMAIVELQQDGTELEPCAACADPVVDPACATLAEPVCGGGTPSCAGYTNTLDEAGYYRSRWGAGAGCGPEDYVCPLFCRPCRQSCLLSTGDLYLHYPYLPEAGGYYYFRPYNYTHIAQHQHLASIWGAPAFNPYSHALFDKLNNVEIDQPAVVRQKLPTRTTRLPNLNDLLDPPVDPE